MIEWNDYDNADGVRPASVTLHLLADGEDTGTSVEATEGSGWQWSFEGLPECKNGEQATYRRFGFRVYGLLRREDYP